MESLHMIEELSVLWPLAQLERASVSEAEGATGSNPVAPANATHRKRLNSIVIGRHRLTGQAVLLAQCVEEHAGHLAFVVDAGQQRLARAATSTVLKAPLAKTNPWMALASA